MKIGIICSNYHNIDRKVANGTSIFNYSLITGLVKHASEEGLEITAFASGASDLPVGIESIGQEPLSSDRELAESGRHFLYEQALIAKAFSMQDKFDLYHVNIGDGDIAMPFSMFTDKPILITIHNVRHTDYMRKFFSLFQDNRNVCFISASEAQRKLMPALPFINTVYHGVDPEAFAFNEKGGESMMWAGRAIPDKGPEIVIDVAQKTGHSAKLFGIPKPEHEEWFRQNVLDRITAEPERSLASFKAGIGRFDLIEPFQKSKLFLFPISCEESFGFVIAEAMSCGTPVVAFAKGAIPEVIKDGETGFIINASDDDVRGDWTIKKTGTAGLIEAVERIYAMSEEEYGRMRQACRKRVLENFTVEQMIKGYIAVYRKALDRNN